jgi:FKBP-type peptidyl-prolyl cis-trans isomerase SlyD
MRIDRDTVVTIVYELKDCDGVSLEEEGARMAYLHGGFDGIFQKVEQALQGREVGHEVNVTLEPDEAFGDYDAELLRVEPRERFPAEIEVGMRFEGVPGEDESQSRIYTVTDVTDEAVVVDGNHPLAGERLWFKCSVADVRRATPEEIEHGHPHGEIGLSTH